MLQILAQFGIEANSYISPPILSAGIWPFKYWPIYKFLLIF